eukprot:Pgem_evm1s7721
MTYNEKSKQFRIVKLDTSTSKQFRIVKLDTSTAVRTTRRNAKFFTYDETKKRIRKISDFIQKFLSISAFYRSFILFHNSKFLSFQSQPFLIGTNSKGYFQPWGIFVINPR